MASHSYAKLDQWIAEYFIFRGFVLSAKTVESESKNAKDKAYRVCVIKYYIDSIWPDHNKIWITYTNTRWIHKSYHAQKSLYINQLIDFMHDFKSLYLWKLLMYIYRYIDM